MASHSPDRSSSISLGKSRVFFVPALKSGRSQRRPKASDVACPINSGKQAGNVSRLLQLIIQPTEELIVSHRCHPNLAIRGMFVCMHASADTQGRLLLGQECLLLRSLWRKPARCKHNNYCKKLKLADNNKWRWLDLLLNEMGFCTRLLLMCLPVTTVLSSCCGSREEILLCEGRPTHMEILRAVWLFLCRR